MSFNTRDWRDNIIILSILGEIEEYIRDWRIYQYIAKKLYWYRAVFEISQRENDSTWISVALFIEIEIQPINGIIA